MRRFGLGMSALLAWRNLTHDQSRFAVTLIGIAFAVILIAIQLGLFKGFSEITTMVIRHNRADIWIVNKGARNFEITVPLTDRELYIAKSTAGVADAEGLVAQFAAWRRPDGGNEGVFLLGYNLNSTVTGVWGLTEGNSSSLRLPSAVIVDRLYLEKLGIQGRGDVIEIAGHRARIVALTEGVRSFTTSPLVFTSARTAQDMAGLRPDEWSYVLVTVEPGAKPSQVRDALRSALTDADVYLSDELAERTNHYWTYTTGAGASVLLSAMLGVVVGVVIVAQVLYATTIDHLTEFGTLRAMGAPEGFIYRVILEQATISAALGHTIGMTIAMPVAALSRHGPVLVSLTLELAVALFSLTLVMCVTAALISIRKVLTLDPVMVFQR